MAIPVKDYDQWWAKGPKFIVRYNQLISSSDYVINIFVGFKVWIFVSADCIGPFKVGILSIFFVGFKVCSHFRAQKSADFQGPPLLMPLVMDAARLETITYRAV